MTSEAPFLVDDSNYTVQYQSGWDWQHGLLDKQVDNTQHAAPIANINASLAFVGTGIEVVGVLEPANGQPQAQFTIDNRAVGSYLGPSPPPTTARYNVTYFSKLDLAPGDHVIVVTNLKASPDILLLDYFLVYPNSHVAQSTTTTTPNTPSSSSSAPSSSASETSASASHSKPVGAIVGGTIGGVVFIVAVCLFFLFLRRRRSSESHPEANHASSPSQAFNIPATAARPQSGAPTTPGTSPPLTPADVVEKTDPEVSDPSLGSYAPDAVPLNPTTTQTPTSTSPTPGGRDRQSAVGVEQIHMEEVAGVPWYAPGAPAARVLDRDRLREGGRPAEVSVDSGLRAYADGTLPPPYTAG